VATLSLDRLGKRFGRAPPAVDAVSLEVADGELVTLVGPSGCGKSTLLRMIAGLEEISSGELRIDGVRVNDTPARERNLAMVFQSYALYPHLSLFENIAFPLRLARRPEEEVRRRVREVAELLQLAGLERRPAELSGGQRQRVAMGRAIVRHPRAFLFDEPLSNLDAKLRGHRRTEIARLQRTLGVTTVYVTHDQTEALTLGQRVAVLRAGTLQQVAPPRELYERPANLFVAGFIGTPPMNFLPARVESGAARLPFGTLRLPDETLQRVGRRSLVVAGVRPEHVQDATAVPPASPHEGVVAFELPVAAVEWLGNAQYAYLSVAGPGASGERLRALPGRLDGDAAQHELVVSLDAESRLKPGERARLRVDARRVLLFDAEEGQALGPAWEVRPGAGP
jgi:multiple sugar transport system ATP-binding protein